MPIAFIDSLYGGPEAGDLHLVHCTDVKGLIRLSRASTGIRSFDCPKGKQSIEQMYEFVGVPPPQAFASCFALFGPIASGSKINAYGLGKNVVTLLLNADRLMEDAVVVNGDFQNLASGLSDGPLAAENVLFFRHQSKDATLHELNVWRSDGPIRGDYCEARLMRPIVPEDIDKIYATDLCGEIDELVKQINSRL